MIKTWNYKLKDFCSFFNAAQWLLSKISFWRPKPSAPTLTAATQVTRQSAPPPPKAPQSSRANPARGTTEMGVSPQPPSPKTAMAFNPLQVRVLLVVIATASPFMF